MNNYGIFRLRKGLFGGWKIQQSEFDFFAPNWVTIARVVGNTPEARKTALTIKRALERSNKDGR